MDRLRSSRKIYQWPIALMLLLVVLGCTPKRVMETNPATSKPVIARNDQEQDLEIPFPRTLGRAGLEPGKNAGSVKPSPATVAGKNSAGKSSGVGVKAAALAKKQLGKQYQWGAEGPDKFDCSGLAVFVYKKLGYQLPRNSRAQAKNGKAVSRKDLQPGDLLFFVTSGKTINHVGIYVGGNKFVHAPRKHKPVSTGDLNNSWWSQRLKAIRRLV
jgi:cell wall-associated NlpC family hydrolase